MKHHGKFILGCLVAAASATAHAGSLSNSATYSAVSAEIISFDRATGNLFATANTQVECIDFANPASLSRKFLVSFPDVFESGIAVANVSSVAADPLGRGFAAAALINDHDTTVPGRVVLFDTETGAVIAGFEVGYHPDCVAFSDDGAYVVTADEGEWSATGTQTPGSVSVIAIGAATTKAGLSSLSQSAAFTCDFSAGNLGEFVSIANLRVSDPAGEGLPNGLEPEYVSSTGGKVYASLQEASAIAVLDIASRKFTDIIRMPAVDQTIDASDKDGGIHIDDSVVRCLPMPDTIKAFTSSGRVYIVTANEGDFRPDDGDKARVKELGTKTYPALDPAYKASLDALYGGNAIADSALGRLNVSTIDGLNGLGQIALLNLPGTRSFSIYDAAAFTRVWDSGSAFETLTAELDPSGYQDGRSDDKGPEPEGITVFEFHGRRYAAIVMERTYALFVYDITNPEAPFFSAYTRAATGEEPESVLFVSADDSPDGKAKLVVSYEATCTVNVFDIAADWAGCPRAIGDGPADTGSWMGTVWLSGNWVYAYGTASWWYMPEGWVDDSGAWAYLAK